MRLMIKMRILEITETRRKWQQKEMEKVLEEIGEYKEKQKEKKLKNDWNKRYAIVENPKHTKLKNALHENTGAKN